MKFKCGIFSQQLHDETTRIAPQEEIPPQASYKSKILSSAGVKEGLRVNQLLL